MVHPCGKGNEGIERETQVINCQIELSAERGGWATTRVKLDRKEETGPTQR